jgi:hypothetical protein
MLRDAFRLHDGPEEDAEQVPRQRPLLVIASGAKQAGFSLQQRKAGLLRRFAPRNDGIAGSARPREGLSGRLPARKRRIHLWGFEEEKKMDPALSLRMTSEAQDDERMRPPRLSPVTRPRPTC